VLFYCIIDASVVVQKQRLVCCSGFGIPRLTLLLVLNFQCILTFFEPSGDFPEIGAGVAFSLQAEERASS
jgi:hypothetical protein